MQKSSQHLSGPRWLLLLIGVPIAVSVLMLLSMWSTLHAQNSLRATPDEDRVKSIAEVQPLSLHEIVQQRRNKTVLSSDARLHADDLARSNSYEHWAPVVVEKCLHGMNKSSAPCVKEAQPSNMVEAQELLYPAFRLRLPHFASPAMQSLWLSQGLHLGRMRVSEDKEWAEYPAFQGQNMVFENAVFRGNPPPDVWSDESCMGGAASHTSFLHNANSHDNGFDGNHSVDTLVIATTPDSWSFQHFIDRVAVVWSQAQLVIPAKKKAETVIVAGRKPRDNIVNEIYERMVGQHLHKTEPVSARRLVFSCRAPLIHPYTTQRITENIMQSLPAVTIDVADRNVILFLSRNSKGGKAHNGGRQILNEEKLFDAINAMLKAEGRSEKLQYFRHSDFHGLEQVATFMRDRVKMMIGPHGAAFYNARFARPQTTLIEIVPSPDKFFVPCFWEQARLLGQDYSAHVGKVVNRKNDMEVESIEEVVGLVHERLVYLSESYRSSDALGSSYSWKVATKSV